MAPCGLVGYLFTWNIDIDTDVDIDIDIDQGFQVGGALQVGMPGVNTGTAANPAAPFGDVKASELCWEGRRAGIEVFLEQSCMAVPRAYRLDITYTDGPGLQLPTLRQMY